MWVSAAVQFFFKLTKILNKRRLDLLDCSVFPSTLDVTATEAASSEFSTISLGNCCMGIENRYSAALGYRATMARLLALFLCCRAWPFMVRHNALFLPLVCFVFSPRSLDAVFSSRFIRALCNEKVGSILEEGF